MTINEILKQMNVSSDVQAIILKEDATDEQVTAAVEKWKDHQKIIIQQNYATEMKTAISEEMMIAISNPAIKELRKSFNFTDEEVKGKSVKEIAQMAAGKVKILVKEASEQTDEKLSNKVDKLNKLLSESKDEIKIRDNKIEEESKKVEREIRKFKVGNYLVKQYGKLNWDDKDKSELYTEALNARMGKYVIDPKTGAIKNEDGTAVQNPDGSGVWETADKAIEFFANKHKMTAQSNGETGGQHTITAVEGATKVQPVPSSLAKALEAKSPM